MVTVNLLPDNVASGACAAVDTLLFVLVATQSEISFLVSPSPDTVALWARVPLARGCLGPQCPGSGTAFTSLSLVAAPRAVWWLALGPQPV